MNDNISTYMFKLGILDILEIYTSIVIIILLVLYYLTWRFSFKKRLKINYNIEQCSRFSLKDLYFYII